MSVFLEDNIQRYAALRAGYDADPAGLYLYDIGGYAGRALAESQLSPSMVAWKGYEKEVSAQLWELPGASAYRARFNGWLAEGGTTRAADLLEAVLA